MNLTKTKTKKQTRSKEITETSNDWFTPWRFAVVLAALILVCFPAVVAGFETFYFRDFGSFGYPLAFYHRESFWRGELPLWNPYNYCGLPFLAQWNTLTLYPPSLFYLLFPLSWSLGVFNLIHMLWAGLGMYLLARRWTGNRLAASVGGIAFAFNGLTWHSLMWPNNIAAFGWMPWVVLLVEKTWRAEPGKSARTLAVAALAGAMQMLAGAPEIILLTWAISATLCCVVLVRGDIPRRRVMVSFLGIAGLVAGLTAAQLLPFLDLLAHSQRDTNFAGSQWAMPLTGWINYLVPLFHMFPEKGIFSQYDQYWTASYYLGAAIVALALLALVPFKRGQKRDQRIWVLAGLALLGLVMSLGSNGLLYSGFKAAFPFLGFMRYPIKFVVLPTFAIPLLAAFAVARFQALSPEEWRIESRKLVIAGVVLIGLMAIFSLWEWVRPPQFDDPVAAVGNAVVRAVFLALILGCFALLRRIKETKLHRLLQIGLLMLLWFDVFTHAPNVSPTVERAVFEPDTIREYFKWDGQQLRPGDSRAMQTPKAFMRIALRGVSEPGADVNGRRLSLYSDYNLLDHAAKVDGLYSLIVREMGDLQPRLYGHTNDVPRLEDFLGVARISNPTNAVDWLPRKTFLPFITAGQEPVFATADESLSAIFSDTFEPARTVYLEAGAKGTITAHGTTAKVITHQVEAQRVSAEVEANAPALVVFSQSFYHCWRAYVDGNPAQLWRANHAFQAVEVPAGRHTVKLVYEDSAFKWGAVISLASLLAVFLSSRLKV